MWHEPFLSVDEITIQVKATENKKQLSNISCGVDVLKTIVKFAALVFVGPICALHFSRIATKADENRSKSSKYHTNNKKYTVL